MRNNLETVRDFYEAFGRNDLPAMLEHLSENVQWEPWVDNYAQKAGVPWLQERQGKEGALEFFNILETFSFTDFRVVAIMGEGNKVAAECVLNAQIPPSATPVIEEEVHVFTFDEDGKIIRFRHYCDTAKQIAAAGL